MPYAFIAQVTFGEGSDRDVDQKVLESDIIPLVSSQAGFQKGLWCRNVDGTTGIGTAVFDTKANAEAAGQNIRQQQRPAEAPEITSAGVYEVVGEA